MTMPEPRWVCEECVIFFGRHKDWAIHWMTHHAEMDPERKALIERMIERLRSAQDD